MIVTGISIFLLLFLILINPLRLPLLIAFLFIIF